MTAWGAASLRAKPQVADRDADAPTENVIEGLRSPAARPNGAAMRLVGLTCRGFAPSPPNHAPGACSPTGSPHPRLSHRAPAAQEGAHLIPLVAKENCASRC